ncbi:MAG: metallophosphoesterase family protein [Candidatus Sumerlaeaceae bacterium]
MTKEVLNIAAVGDVHCTRMSQGAMANYFAHMADQADIILLAGDITDYGLPEEAHILVKELGRAMKVPIVTVLGNHDFESGKQEELSHILRDAGVHVLDGESFDHEGVSIVGVKGFGGGFGRRMLEPWGEEANKGFVREAMEEAIKLERGLAKAHEPHKIVLLHYSPIRETVEGEPLETYAFLGSTRLEEPINRFGVRVVFHGHAHRGALKGKTHDGIPVYNVSLPLLRQDNPDHPGFMLYQVALTTAESAEIVGNGHAHHYGRRASDV